MVDPSPAESDPSGGCSCVAWNLRGVQPGGDRGKGKKHGQQEGAPQLAKLTYNIL